MFVRFHLAHWLLLSRTSVRHFARHRARLGLLIAISAPVCGGGCLYTDPINMPPRFAQIIPAGPVWRNLPATFTASVSDPNGDAVSLAWAHTVGCPIASPLGGGPCNPCPVGSNDYRDPSRWPPYDPVPQQSYTVAAAETDQPFCIWAFATDRHGAVEPAILPVNPLNHLPSANIRVVKPHMVNGASGIPRYAEIELSGDDSTDADPGDLGRLKFEWSLVRRAAGSGLATGALAGTTCSSRETTSSWCFVPDIEGTYLVQLMVQDGYVNPDAALVPPFTVTRELTVARDQLPCLASVDPLSPVVSGANADDDQNFSVRKVDDDGDPYPPSGAIHFNWFKGLASGPLQPLGNDVAQLTVHGSEFASGQEIVVRVEIADRNAEAIKAILQACGDKDICGEINAQSACNQRMTWRIQYR